jgi:hypothetical protein
MAIGAESGRQFSVPQQLVKHLPAVVFRLGQLNTRLLAQGVEQAGRFYGVPDSRSH